MFVNLNCTLKLKLLNLNTVIRLYVIITWLSYYFVVVFITGDLGEFGFSKVISSLHTFELAHSCFA